MKIYAKKTFSQRKEDVEHRWILVDAKSRVLGQLATEIAQLLTGKNKPTYTSHIDGGDYVVVINADQVVVTGRKETDKIYHRHSGYPGALKSETVSEMRARKPEMIIELAVKNMVPKNKLRQDRLGRLKVFAGEQQPYAGQIKASAEGKFSREQRQPVKKAAQIEKKMNQAGEKAAQIEEKMNQAGEKAAQIISGEKKEGIKDPSKAQKAEKGHQNASKEVKKAHDESAAEKKVVKATTNKEAKSDKKVTKKAETK